MNEPQETISPGDARRVLELERQQRAAACLGEIQTALDKHHCQLVGLPRFTPDGRTVADIQVLPQQED